MATSYMSELVPPPPPKDDTGNKTDARRPAEPPLGLDVPPSPVPPSPVEKARKYSPLTDLIESEKVYVELLTGIIRKVAAAWSRSNLPPPELDSMFRSVEGVYKTNRTLLARLKEIGENPSSPKALGDLLMRWIDELEQPYMTYADRYCIGFDEWEPIKANARLPAVLQGFSTSNPPPSVLPQPTYLLNPSLWTLDALFLLPKGRLQYYRKLYSRLLKSTTPGRSDHRLLTGALGKLDGLLVTLEHRANTGVDMFGQTQVLISPHISNGANPTTVIPMEPSASEPIESSVLLSGKFGVDPPSVATSFRGSSSSRDERLSQETTLTSVSRESYQSMSSVLDLEGRLATENTVDIFTMKPKQIRLQIASPSLSYARELRLSAKVFVRFIPTATGVEVIHRRGHIYILSDLFLLTEEMVQEEKVARRGEGKDMHLCYPPLSGKVLSVMVVSGQVNVLQISIMRKETLILETGSQPERDRIYDEFLECISFAKTISRAAQEPVPPMSSLSISQSPPTGPQMRERPERGFNPRLLPQSESSNISSEQTNDDNSLVGRSSSKPSINLPATPISQQHFEQQITILNQLDVVQDSRHGVVNSPPGSPLLGNDQRAPTSHNSRPVFPPRRSSRGYATNSSPFSFMPGQIVPPMRSASIQSLSPPFGATALDPPGGSVAVCPPTAPNPALQNPTLRQHASMHSLRQQPLERRPSLDSLPHRLHHQTVPPTPHPQPGLHSVNRQPSLAHPSVPSVIPHPVSSHKLQKSSSTRSLHAQYQYQYSPNQLPPIPSLPDGLSFQHQAYDQRNDPMGSLNTSFSKPLLPSMQMGSKANTISEPSPPMSPVEERKPLGPVRSVITAQMKCKVFFQQQHAQWKSLGSANLTLYRQEPTNVKQLVVEAGSKDKTILISTIVLTDGVERVGKTGVAIELSDAGGARTGVIYMIQLRNEDSATELFKTLLAGSDRAA